MQAFSFFPGTLIYVAVKRNRELEAAEKGNILLNLAHFRALVRRRPVWGDGEGREPESITQSTVFPPAGVDSLQMATWELMLLQSTSNFHRVPS